MHGGGQNKAPTELANSPHALDVQPTSRHIRGHQHRVGVVSEAVQGLQPLPLLHACVRSWGGRDLGLGLGEGAGAGAGARGEGPKQQWWGSCW